MTDPAGKTYQDAAGIREAASPFLAGQIMASGRTHSANDNFSQLRKTQGSFILHAFLPHPIFPFVNAFSHAMSEG